MGTSDAIQLGDIIAIETSRMSASIIKVLPFIARRLDPSTSIVS